MRDLSSVNMKFLTILLVALLITAYSSAQWDAYTEDYDEAEVLQDTPRDEPEERPSERRPEEKKPEERPPERKPEERKPEERKPEERPEEKPKEERPSRCPENIEQFRTNIVRFLARGLRAFLKDVTDRLAKRFPDMDRSEIERIVREAADPRLSPQQVCERWRQRGEKKKSDTAKTLEYDYY